MIKIAARFAIKQRTNFQVWADIVKISGISV